MRFPIYPQELHTHTTKPFLKLQECVGKTTTLAEHLDDYLTDSLLAYLAHARPALLLWMPAQLDTDGDCQKSCRHSRILL